MVRRAVQLAIESDEPWQLTLAAAGDFVTDAPGFRPVPAARLQWVVEDGSEPEWQPVALDPVVVAAGPGGEGQALVALSFRLDVGWDAAATTPYQTALVFTAAPGAALAASFAQPLSTGPGEAPRCLIGYWVPGEGPATVRIRMSDETGEPLREAVVQQVGGRWHTWEWDGRDHAGQPLAPALYYYTVTGDDERILAAGVCAPPDGLASWSSDLQVQVLSAAALGEPALRLEAKAHPQRVSGGDWLRLDWTLENIGPSVLHPVKLTVDLPQGWQPVGLAAEVLHDDPGAAGTPAPGTRRWFIPVDQLEPGTVLQGHVWVAVAPGTRPGEYHLRAAAIASASGMQVSASTNVPVTVAPGPFESGRLVARVVVGNADRGGAGSVPSPTGIAFQVLGGPRLEADAAGVASWTGPPGLYLLIPDAATVPPGWWAPTVPFRLTPGAITYVEVPLTFVA
ncbi:MAG TPA: hypothetical protein VIK93_00880, partial [Limnochordales bacterium]